MPLSLFSSCLFHPVYISLHSHFSPWKTLFMPSNFYFVLFHSFSYSPSIFFSISLPVQHVPTLLVMKPISVTEIVSMATEVLIITDTPTARAGEEYTRCTHMYAGTRTYTHITMHEEEHTADNDKDKLFTNLIYVCIYLCIYQGLHT